MFILCMSLATQLQCKLLYKSQSVNRKKKYIYISASSFYVRKSYTPTCCLLFQFTFSKVCHKTQLCYICKIPQSWNKVANIWNPCSLIYMWQWMSHQNPNPKIMTCDLSLLLRSCNRVLSQSWASNSFAKSIHPSILFKKCHFGYRGINNIWCLSRLQ